MWKGDQEGGFHKGWKRPEQIGECGPGRNLVAHHPQVLAGCLADHTPQGPLAHLFERSFPFSSTPFFNIQQFRVGNVVALPGFSQNVVLCPVEKRLSPPYIRCHAESCSSEEIDSSRFLAYAV